MSYANLPSCKGKVIFTLNKFVDTAADDYYKLLRDEALQSTFETQTSTCCCPMDATHELGTPDELVEALLHAGFPDPCCKKTPTLEDPKYKVTFGEIHQDSPVKVWMTFSTKRLAQCSQKKLVKVYYLERKNGRWPTKQEVKDCKVIPEEHAWMCDNAEDFHILWTYEYGVEKLES
jgi:hypothetical protein